MRETACGTLEGSISRFTMELKERLLKQRAEFRLKENLSTGIAIPLVLLGT